MDPSPLARAVHGGLVHAIIKAEGSSKGSRSLKRFHADTVDVEATIKSEVLHVCARVKLCGPCDVSYPGNRLDCMTREP